MDTSDFALEEDVFAALRVLRRGQVALLAPVVETRRRAPGPGGSISERGGGLGDVNLAARWDFTRAGASPVVPGLAALAGVTFPTGRPPESARNRLATDATGIGAFQLNAGLAAEQTWGPWLVSVSAFAAKRTTRKVQGIESTLATQWTFLAASAYTFPSDAALALVLSYAVEGDATVDGAPYPGTGRRIPTMTFTGLLPIDDRWRILGSVFTAPAIHGLGRNDPAQSGLSLGIVRSWS
jgi:hypothetical protein